MVRAQGNPIRPPDSTYGDFGRDYFQAMFRDQALDCSFALMAGDSIVALAQCTAMCGTIGYFNRPARLAFGSGAEDAADQVLLQIDRLAEANAATNVRILDPQPGQQVSTSGLACLKRNAAPNLSLICEADLSRSEADLYADVRKSYKSLINWGRRKLQVVYVNASNPDAQGFQAFRDLHRQAAGRQTRSDVTWQVMFDWLCKGAGELSLGYEIESGSLVSAGLILDGADAAEYSSAAYDRSRFDKPLAHWLLWDAMLRARQRGKTRFTLGEIPVKDRASDKEYGVGYFKKGFSSRVVQELQWTWQPSTGQRPA